MIKYSKLKKESIFLVILKNFSVFLFGAITGEIIFIIYFLSITVNNIAEKAGLGIIALAPVVFIIYSLFSIIIGGILGIVIFNVYKHGKRKRK